MTSSNISPAYEQAAETFYQDVLAIMNESAIPFVLGGTYAVKQYVDLTRPTKDLDIFCTAGDYPKILKRFADRQYQVAVEDERWLARIYQDPYFVDLIYGSIPGVWPISSTWIDRAVDGEVLGVPVKILAPEELIVSKAFRMKRAEFDGADVVHIILKCGATMDWKYLLSVMDTYWEILLIHVLIFRFVYPTKREQVPRWLVDELLHRLELQLSLPAPKDNISRGSILSWEDFRQGVEQWGFKDMTEFTFSKKKPL